MGNENLFSDQAKQYAAGRPTYPQPLFNFLAKRCLQHAVALDCGTGNGQAALGLASIFRDVVAVDISEKQIQSATKLSNIHYVLADSKSLPFIASQSVDLVTVAESAHWFDLEAFYKEARRVLKPNGAIALWSYYLPTISEELDSIIGKHYEVTLAPYSDPRRLPIKNGYKDLRSLLKMLNDRFFNLSKSGNSRHSLPICAALRQHKIMFVPIKEILFLM